jgi:hypothetical protein
VAIVVVVSTIFTVKGKSIGGLVVVILGGVVVIVVNSRGTAIPAVSEPITIQKQDSSVVEVVELDVWGGGVTVVVVVPVNGGVTVVDDVSVGSPVVDDVSVGSPVVESNSGISVNSGTIL